MAVEGQPCRGCTLGAQLVPTTAPPAGRRPAPLPAAEYGTGPAAYVNRYRNAWPAALANIALAIEDAKRRRGRGELKLPTGTCGGLVVTELPAPMAAIKFNWEQLPVGGGRGRGGLGWGMGLQRGRRRRLALVAPWCF